MARLWMSHVLISGIILPFDRWRGRVVWLSAHAWKACNPQRFAGSNPALSADDALRNRGVFSLGLRAPMEGMIFKSRPLRLIKNLPFTGRFLCTRVLWSGSHPLQPQPWLDRHTKQDCWAPHLVNDLLWSIPGWPGPR